MDNQKRSWWRVLGSVCAAFFGVQSEQNRQHDFSKETFWRFILGALLMAFVFISAVYLLVQLALRQMS